MELNVPKKNLIVGNVGFHIGTQEELLTMIEEFTVPPEGAYVSFIGAPHVVLAQDDPTVAEVYNRAAIACADGMPIVKLAQKMGCPGERCSGPDIMEQIIARGIAKGKRHFFYGASQEVLEKLCQNLKEKYPEIQIVGTYSPPFRVLSEEEDNAIVQNILAQRADYVWVALGSPKQDIWMLEHKERLNRCKLMGVGAAFNFLAGRIRRAPAFMQKAGLEWLYRLTQEPRRLWRRYFLIAPRFLGVRHLTLKRHRAEERARKKAERQTRSKEED